MKLFSSVLFTLTLLLAACGNTPPQQVQDSQKDPNTNPEQSQLTTMETSTPITSSGKTQLATLGAGCFWCVEAVFQDLKGVLKVESGYSGGKVKNPTYKEICTGRTGHAEVIQITYDPDILPFEKVLYVFFMTHDPTTLNRQGNDVGTQYRSAIFYHSPEQKQIAEETIEKLNKTGAFNGPIVTEVTAFSTYYPAEDYHQNYFKENGDQPYCQFVIRPKVEKFRKAFKEDLIK